MAMKPLADRVLVQVLEEQEEKSAGGLVLVSKKLPGVPARGTVIAVGDGKLVKGHRIPPEVKVGDTVLFGADAGTKVKLDDVDYVLMYEDEIYGVEV